MHNWIEQRQHFRHPVRIAGTAVAGDGLDRLAIQIVNLSEAGAMVELPANAQLVDDVVLLFNHTAEPCRKIWHAGRLAGVEFIELP